MIWNKITLEQTKFNAAVIQVKDKLWKPQVREEGTMEVVVDELGHHKGYLINGFNGEGIRQIVEFTISK